MAEVRLNHLIKTYDEKVRIIDDVSLDIADKEFIVLVGPSGCGKSTLLRMIAGLESITSGDIHIEDRLVNDVSPKDRDIAMVFQSYALYPHMSVYDNMAFGLKMRKTPKEDIKRRVEEAAKILDLSALLDRKPRQLSGGQRQRVALGRAIVRNPKVFLMDEPLSNLDAKLRVQMRTEIQKLHRSLNATTIYVTHDQIEAMTMGDRIVILNGGIIQQVGDPTLVYQFPANIFVGGFIGTMHFVSATLSGTQLKFSGSDLWELSGKLSPEILEKLQASLPASGSIQIGIRPEHFDVLNSDSQQSVTVTPEIIEMLGHEKLVHFTWSAQSLTASLPPDSEILEGAPVTIGLQLNKCSFFNPDTGLNIGL